MTAALQYVYCVVPAEIDMSNAPRGIDRVSVSEVRSREFPDIAALVSPLDGVEYSGDRVSEMTGDTAWLTPRAVAHDALVTWAGDAGPVIPLPMWVMFRDEAAVMAMLAERGSEFRGALERISGAREFGVRISGDRSAIATAAEKLDGDIARLEAQASAAPPGQAYLLRRKLAEARKIAARDAAAVIAEQVHDSLAALSRASVARATALSREPGVILDGAYLVPTDQYEAFRSALTGIIADYEPAGLRFDFTGPWPPYHFVSAT